MPRRCSRLLAFMAVATLLGGCGLLGGQPPPASPTIGALETGRITVAVLPTVEIAPLMLAIEEGWFADAGLDVQVEIAGSGPTTIAGVIGGDYDIAYSSFVPFIAAQAKQVADLRIVTDNSYAAPNTAMVVTPPDSTLTSVLQLEGKRIAVPGPNTSADLMVKSAMDVNNLDHTTVAWIPLPFPDMAAALQRGDIDAAMMVEPFITTAAMSIGAVALLDLSSGPTSELPFTGYGATAEFVREHPNTIAVFQQVMRRAAEAAHGRARVEALLPKIVTIDQATARLVNLPGFRSTLDAERIQRVADLMLEFGVLDAHLDVAPMLLRHPKAVLPSR